MGKRTNQAGEQVDDDATDTSAYAPAAVTAAPIATAPAVVTTGPANPFVVMFKQMFVEGEDRAAGAFVLVTDAAVATHLCATGKARVATAAEIDAFQAKA